MVLPSTSSLCTLAQARAIIDLRAQHHDGVGSEAGSGACTPHKGILGVGGARATARRSSIAADDADEALAGGSDLGAILLRRLSFASTSRGYDANADGDDKAGAAVASQRASSSSADSFPPSEGSVGEAPGDAPPELEPMDRGWGAYRFLAGSAIFETMIWGGAYSFGSFQNYFEHDPRSGLYGRASPTATSAIGTLVIAGQHFAPLLTRGFFRTYPHLIKRTALGSILLSGVSLLIASACETNVAALLAFQGILYGILSGVTFAPVILWLPQWFDKRRGTASGIIYSGSGIGGTILPIVAQQLLDRVGFAWTLRITAAYTVVLTGLALWLLKPRLPIIRLQAATAATAAAASSAHNESVFRADTDTTTNHDLAASALRSSSPGRSRSRSRTRSLLRTLSPGSLHAMLTPLGLVCSATIICQASAWCTVSLYIASYASSLGLSSATATGVLSAFNAAATVGYLVGRLIDLVRAPYTFIMAASAATCALLAFFLLGFASSLPLLLVFVLLFGMAGGGFTTFMTPLSKDLALVRNQDMVALNLALIFVRGFAAVGGPLVGGSLYDQRKAGDYALYGTRGFRGLVVFVGSGMILAAGFALAATFLRRRYVR